MISATLDCYKRLICIDTWLYIYYDLPFRTERMTLDVYPISLPPFCEKFCDKFLVWACVICLFKWVENAFWNVTVHKRHSYNEKWKGITFIKYSLYTNRQFEIVILRFKNLAWMSECSSSSSTSEGWISLEYLENSPPSLGPRRSSIKMYISRNLQN